MNSVISNRLLEIASMIEDYKNVYDVGCDHAYLDIYLTLYKHNKCYPIDVRKKVVDAAISNIKKFNLDISVTLNNGLENIDIKPNSVVVIAGMGTRTILKIIKDKNIEELIIQSNDDLPLLRKTLSDWNYEIIDEKVVFENNYFYVLIKFRRGISNYTYEQLLLGPVLMKKKNDLVYTRYLKYLSFKFNRMIESIPVEFRYNKNILLDNKNIVDNFLNI